MFLKYGVVRSPPFHHVEYDEPERMVVPPLPSRTKRWCIAEPT